MSIKRLRRSIRQLVEYTEPMKIYFDPEAQVMYTAGGSAVPVRALKGTDFAIVKVPTGIVWYGLIEDLLGVSSKLYDLSRFYQGTTWDGRNYIGSWSEEAHSEAREIAEYLEFDYKD